MKLSSDAAASGRVGVFWYKTALALVSPAHLFLRRGKDVRESKRDELGGMIMIEVRAADLLLPRE